MRPGIRPSSAGARPRDDTGAVAVLFGILAVILFVLAGLVVDLGQARDVRRESQNAADASALAAAAKLYPASGTCSNASSPPCYADAVTAATTYAAANYATTAGDWSACTDANRYYATATTQCVSFTDATQVKQQLVAPLKPTYVRVAMPVRQVSSGLIGLGTNGRSTTIPVGSAARVALNPGGQAACGLCLVGDTAHSLQNGNIVLTATSLQANNIITAKNNGGIVATNGNISVSGASCGNCTAVLGSVQVNQPVITDPLASVTLPNQANSFFNSPTGLKTNPCVDGPGYYKSPAPSPGGCAWKPGLYVITGSLGGNTLINALGVTLFFACGTSPAPSDCASGGEAGGSLGFTGNGALVITAPTTGPTAGLSIVYDRHNTASMDMKGNGALSAFTGTVYALSATLGFRGNGAGVGIDSLIVVNDIDFRGNPSALALSYTAANNVIIPPGDGALDQ